MKILILIISL